MTNSIIKILAIDDNQDNLITLQALINEVFPNALVLKALTGSKGIALAASENPDVILLDIVMPGMDGFKVCEKLKVDRLTEEIPVIFVTAIKDDKTNLIRALESGGDAFLTKPIDVSELSAQIRAMVKIREHNRRESAEKESLTRRVAKSEAALIASEEKFRNLVWDMQVGVLLQGPNAEILLSNPKALEMLGLSEDQLMGKSSFDPDWNVIHEDGSPFPGSDHPVPQAIATREPVRDVIMGVFNPALRKYVWLLVHAEPQLDEQGQIQQVVCTFIDISTRIKAEKDLIQLNEELEDRVKSRTAALVNSYDSLSQAEEKYRTVADFTYGWEFWLDQDDNFRYCSPSCKRITGYSAAEFMQNPKLLHDTIYPDDLPIFLAHAKKEKLALEANQEIEYRVVRLDGEIRWTSHVCQPIYNQEGEFIGTRGSNRDITDKKIIEQLLITSEKKYKLLSENITDGIFIYKNSRFDYVNTAMNTIFGYDDQELEGLTANQLLTQEYQEKLNSFTKSNSQLNQIRNIELEGIKKDHSTVFVELLINYIAGEKAIYGVVHDITERKQNEHNIAKAIILTEEKERSYYSKELHDGLGPLLSTIKLYLQWSQRPKSNKSREEIIQKAGDILEDALAAVREISNKLSPHLLTYYGLTSAIQSFVEKLKETSAINISFESTAVRRLESEIEATIYRAVIECINNTIKHAQAKNIYIMLDDTVNQLLLQYRDDGAGFDLEDALSAHKGLGLFNLQNRIQTIGGKITLFSQPQQGVDYRIILDLGK